MTRGNQREKDRERNLKKRAASQTKRTSGADLKQAQEQHASIMRAKQKASEEKHTQKGSGT